MAVIPDKPLKLIIYHSMPANPCPDGLISFYLETKIGDFTESQILAYNYTRSKDSFKQLDDVYFKYIRDNFVNKLHLVTIVYVDVSPEHDKEIDRLKEFSDADAKVIIKDHHKPNDRVAAALELKSWTYIFDANKGAAKIIADQIGKLDDYIERILVLLQFSEYEGMDPSVAGQAEALELSGKIVRSTGLDIEMSKFSIRGDEENVGIIYYILDLLMPASSAFSAFMGGKNVWQDLYQSHTEDNMRVKTGKFIALCNDYVRYMERLVTKPSEDLFSDRMIDSFQGLCDQATEIFKTKSKAITIPVKGKDAQVLVAAIDIVKFGRAMEVLCKTAQKLQEVPFAICINPTSRADNTYYFSLRCANVKNTEVGTARDLAAALKLHGYCTVAGGHPWASGATFSKTEFDNFLSAFDLTEVVMGSSDSSQ